MMNIIEWGFICVLCSFVIILTLMVYVGVFVMVKDVWDDRKRSRG